MGCRLLAAVLALGLCPAAATAAPPAKAASSWATPQIRAVTAAGLFGAVGPATFRPADALTAGELEGLVADLKQRLAPDPAQAAGAAPAPKPVADPLRPVTMTQLDARLVAALGLTQAAAGFAGGARAAGLQVPSRFGTEVVARLLGLRVNHPARDDALERLPADPAPRAEAAYSAARILRLDPAQVDAVRALGVAFALPDLSDWQRQILTVALGRVGMPYVWAGVSDTRQQTPAGVSVPGGYDCSGFVWRVFKLQAYPDEGDLADTLRGRTTYEMSGEVPRTERIPLTDLEPADLVFFGDRGTRSKPTQVGHMGIYLGEGWFVHSSDYGVALARLDGWYARTFAWGRRPLAEAGLEP